ncbi:MAG TPA: SMP-30/gluconolactonase/LRE family protein [Terriglobia bacterium]|nr:SMP-30/gluconolactonase/LRE family protein [Terriglobia bacterium]
MKSKGMLLTALGCLGAMTIFGQAPAPQQGPGVQAPQDSRYAEFRASKCTPPPAAAGGGARGPAAPGAAGAGARGPAAPAGPPAHREYTVTEIPGVIAAGQRWKSIWTGTGNNADGPIATADGGLLVAQNTNSTVMKIDKDNKVSIAYRDTNTGGALAQSKSGALFMVSRGFPTSVIQLEPTRRTLTDMYNGQPLDCIGGVINDLTADSKGGVYFTMGGVYYANPKGVVTKYGTLTGVNGIILSPDEKTLYVTGRIPAPAAPPAAGAAGAAPAGGRGGGGGGGGLVAFDVQADGSLTNERQFAQVGGDGTTVDSQGRIYTTTGGQAGDIQVISPDGKVLGSIPLPMNFITVAFSGPDKKTLYGIFNNREYDEIFTIQMIAQGYKDRAK